VILRKATRALNTILTKEVNSVTTASHVSNIPHTLRSMEDRFYLLLVTNSDLTSCELYIIMLHITRQNCCSLHKHEAQSSFPVSTYFIFGIRSEENFERTVKSV